MNFIQVQHSQNIHPSPRHRIKSFITPITPNTYIFQPFFPPRQNQNTISISKLENQSMRTHNQNQPNISLRNKFVTFTYSSPISSKCPVTYEIKNKINQLPDKQLIFRKQVRPSTYLSRLPPTNEMNIQKPSSLHSTQSTFISLKDTKSRDLNIFDIANQSERNKRPKKIIENTHEIEKQLQNLFQQRMESSCSQQFILRQMEFQQILQF